MTRVHRQLHGNLSISSNLAKCINISNKRAEQIWLWSTKRSTSMQDSLIYRLKTAGVSSFENRHTCQNCSSYVLLPDVLSLPSYFSPTNPLPIFKFEDNHPRLWGSFTFTTLQKPIHIRTLVSSVHDRPCDCSPDISTDPQSRADDYRRVWIQPQRYRLRGNPPRVRTYDRNRSDHMLSRSMRYPCTVYQCITSGT